MTTSPDSHDYCTPGVRGHGVRRQCLPPSQDLDVAAERLSAAAASWPAGFAVTRVCAWHVSPWSRPAGHIDVACAGGTTALAVAQVADSARDWAAPVPNHRLAPYDRGSFVSEFRREGAAR